MNTLGIVLVLALLGAMVVLGAVMSAFCIQRLRRMIAVSNSGIRILPISVHCFPLALGVLFVVYGIAGINKIIGIGDMVMGTSQAMVSIAAQSIPVVIVFLGTYLFLSHQHKKD